MKDDEYTRLLSRGNVALYRRRFHQAEMHYQDAFDVLLRHGGLSHPASVYLFEAMAKALEGQDRDPSCFRRLSQVIERQHAGACA